MKKIFWRGGCHQNSDLGAGQEQKKCFWIEKKNVNHFARSCSSLRHLYLLIRFLKWFLRSSFSTSRLDIIFQLLAPD